MAPPKYRSHTKLDGRRPPTYAREPTPVGLSPSEAARILAAKLLAIATGRASLRNSTASSARGNPPRHRHNPVLGKAGPAGRVKRNYGPTSEIAPIFRISERRLGAQPARGASVLSASPYTPEPNPGCRWRPGAASEKLLRVAS